MPLPRMPLPIHDCEDQQPEFIERRIVDDEKNSQSSTCEFAFLGCAHGHETPSSSRGSILAPESRQHNVGLHMALLLSSLLTRTAMAKFSGKSAESTLTECIEDLAEQDETLNMVNNLDEMRTEEAMAVEELRTNFVNKRVDTENHLKNYDVMLNQDFALQVAEPVRRMKTRAEYLERQEEGTSEEVQKLLKDTTEISILLNHGSVIFKVVNFSDKRTKAIKGELRRGVFGPPFYTHEFGYLMVPILYPNGDGIGAGTHLSVFIDIKKGKYDSLLPRSMEGHVTVSILSQKKDGRKAVCHSFRTDVASLSYHRPTSEMNPVSGIFEALDLSLLRQPSDYLVDDTLFIQIVVDPKLPEK